jgi:hypothetical protein
MTEETEGTTWPSRIEHAEARDILIEYVNGCGSHDLARLYSFAAQKSAEILIDGKSVCRYVKGTIWWELQTHDAAARAAAPELLAASRMALGTIQYLLANSDSGPAEVCMETLVAAIAKAEGRGE